MVVGCCILRSTLRRVWKRCKYSHMAASRGIALLTYRLHSTRRFLGRLRGHIPESQSCFRLRIPGFLVEFSFIALCDFSLHAEPLPSSVFKPLALATWTCEHNTVTRSQPRPERAARAHHGEYLWYCAVAPTTESQDRLPNRFLVLASGVVSRRRRRRHGFDPLQRGQQARGMTETSALDGVCRGPQPCP